MKRILIASMVLLILGIVCFAEDAAAIPVFARKYKTTCMTCHAPFPKLSAFGEAFRLNGYKIPEADEVYVKQEPLSLGAEAYKQMFPRSVWPSTLPGIPPVSFRVTGDVLADTTGTHRNSVDFNFQNEIDIHAAGTFGDHLSFFTEVAFNPGPDNNANGTSTVTTSAAWLMYQNILPCLVGTNHFNVKAGEVGKLEISLPNIRFDNSYQVNDYLYATELNLSSEPGFEMNGFGKNWKYAFGIVKTDTNNSERDFYGQVNFKICGLGYNGTGAKTEEGGLNTAPTGYWRDDSVSFGLFGYRTYDSQDTNNFVNPFVTAVFNPQQVNAFDRFGGDIRVSYANFSIAGGFARGVHNDFILPTLFGGSNNLQVLFPNLPNFLVNENIYTIDAQYFVFPWMVPYARYEIVDVTNIPGLDKQRIVLGMTFLLVGNVRLNLEGRYYTQNGPLDIANNAQAMGLSLPNGVPPLIGATPADIDSNQIAFRLDWAF
jgi:hypothetical protein